MNKKLIKTFSDNIKKRAHTIKENFTILHGHYRHDGFGSIKYNKWEREEIIKRENANFEKWKKMLNAYKNEWEADVYSKTVDLHEDIGERYDDYIYYNATAQEGYDILKRKNNQGVDEVVLDLKTIPFVKDVSTAYLKSMRISKNHNLVGFIVDLDNNEKYYGGLYNIQDKKYYNIRFENISSIEFPLNDDYIIYVENNELNRPCKIKVHQFNSNTKNDRVIFEENNSQVYIETTPTKDHSYLIINSLTKDDSKISLLSLNSEDNFKVSTLFKRQKNVKHFIEHVGGSFYILSNLIVDSKDDPLMKNNKNYKLFTINEKKIENVANNLELLIFPENNEYFEDMDVFKDHVVVYLKKDLHPHLLIHDVNKKTNTRIKVGEYAGEVSPGLNKAFTTNEIRLEYTNPIQFKTLYQFDLKTNKLKTFYESKIKGISKDNFVVENSFAPGSDGEKIPLTLLYKKGINFNRKNKTLLIGYGAYGLNLELACDHVLLSAANRGWVIAYGHLRGGSEKGRDWHEMGKFENKPLIIEDYLACAYELIQRGITHPNYLAGYGTSAGGAVVAQAINLKPELFRAVVLSHPFVDILSTLIDYSLPLTIPDYQEYGNPLLNEKIYHSTLSYSPYENISNQEYPAVLITMSMDDPRVPSWGVLKYIQKLRNKSKQPTRIPDFIDKNICVKIEKSGHFGAINQDEALKNKIWELMWCDKMLIERNNILL